MEKRGALSLAKLAVSAIVLVLGFASTLIFLESAKSGPSNSTLITEVTNSTSETITLRQQTTLSVLQTTTRSNHSSIVNITSIVLMKTGPIGKLLLISSPVLNSSYSAGDSIRLNFSIAFANVEDEGYIQYNASASYANVSISTAGFQLLSVVILQNPNENPIFLPMQNFVHATFVIKLPSASYSGPLSIHFDAQQRDSPFTE